MTGSLERYFRGGDSRSVIIRQKLNEQSQAEAYHDGSLEIQFRFVDITHRGEYHRLGSVDSRQVRTVELIPVLVCIAEDADELAWYGPLWFADPDKNGKKRLVDHIDLTRMHSWSWQTKKDCPRVSLSREEAGLDDVWYYMTRGGNIARVPEIIDEFGQSRSLARIPFG